MRGSDKWSLKTLLTNCKNTDFSLRNLSPRFQESDYRFTEDGVALGRIQTFITPGLELSRMELNLPRGLSIQAFDTEERYVSAFLLKGTIHSSFQEVNLKTEQEEMHHLFSYSRANSGEHAIAPGPCSVVYLNVKPEFLHNYFEDWEAQTSRIQWNKSSRPYSLSQPGNIRRNAGLFHLLADMNENKFTGPARSLLLEAKALELLGLQLEDLFNTTANHIDEQGISRQDREKFEALRHYLSENYLEPISLHDISRQFLLNDFKLKKGFRQLFGETAFQFIRRLKMEKARELLRSREMSLEEVTCLTGYSTVYHFSDAFFKQFKYRPR